MVPHNVPIENSGQIQIVEVIPGSPADQGGVAAQDKILFVNEAPISSPSSLKDVLNLNQDQSSKWTIERSQKRIDLEVILRGFLKSTQARLKSHYLQALFIPWKPQSMKVKLSI